MADGGVSAPTAQDGSEEDHDVSACAGLAPSREAICRALLSANVGTVALVERGGAFLGVLGASDRQLLGTAAEKRTLDELFGAEMAQELLVGLRQGLDRGGEQRMELSIEGGGRQLEFEVRVVPCDANHGLLVFREIGEQRTSERMLRAAQRVAVNGRLSLGALHEINNMLMVIDHGAVRLRQMVAGDSAARMELDAIDQAIQRAAEHSQRVLGASPSTGALAVAGPTLVADFVVRRKAILERMLGAGGRLVVETGIDDPGSVSLGEVELQQVLVNLLINARDAVPRGGRVVLTVTRAELQPGDEVSRGIPVPAGSYVMLEVSDSGSGMGEDTRARLFEPFFTTKPPSLGLGLGLATTWRIVQENQGYVCVDTQLGEGSSFRVYLPRCGRSVVS